MDAVAISAGDQAEAIAARHGGENFARAGDQLGAKRGIMFAPRGVGGVPMVFGQTGGAVHVIPVGRIVFGELVDAPGDAHFAEHGEIRGRIGVERIEQRAVPIEQHAFDFGFCGAGHAAST